MPRQALWLPVVAVVAAWLARPVVASAEEPSTGAAQSKPAAATQPVAETEATVKTKPGPKPKRRNSRFNHAIRLRPSKVISGGGDSEGPTLLTQQIELGALTVDMPGAEIIGAQIPDPIREQERIAEEIKKVKKNGDREYLEMVGKLISQIQRKDQLRISLHDVILRTLANNYQIRTQGYGPAIDATRIVEAEAAFDATLFVNMTNDKRDQPSPSELTSSQRKDFLLTGGITKLLPSGMLVTTSYMWTRTQSNLVFQTLNPAHVNQFVVEFRQPFLRGFGIDFNRSQINIAKTNRQISLQAFKRQVRDTLNDVEEAYWRLTQARRGVTILARLLASFEQIYDYYVRRGEYDAYPVQISLTKTRRETLRAEFIRAKQTVQDAEDQLKALMNDPDINLAMDVELIPVDVPIQEAVILDPVAEVQTALENRAELKEARFSIEQARILRGVAKNQLLPRFDVVFRYAVDGLGGHADDAFDDVTRNDFHEYRVAIEFEYPIGNRAAEAAFRRARLEESQAQAALRAAIEGIIQEVNFSIRNVRTNYDQIAPELAATVAGEADVRARVERQERRDPLTLESELNARQGLAGARESLLESLVDYAVSIATLERAKGTLLQYNNVVLEEAP